ncbi:MAG: hypothetical protein KF845_03450 [Cyclobacteriaceae bacterium]|nr:hypothetical protein [Cyclobacteriaceae bacterium]
MLDNYKSAILFLISLLMLSCLNKKTEKTYYNNGNLKSQVETVNGLKDGVEIEYYNGGIIKSKLHWKKGVLDGSMEEYYTNGKIFRKGHLKNDLLREITSYYESGQVMTKQFYNENGDVREIQSFKENGDRDSIPFPRMHIYWSDTVKIGSPTIFRGRIVNHVDTTDITRDGEMIITSDFDTVKVQDTLAHIFSTNERGFEYKFIPNKLGTNYIHGRFIFRKDDGEHTTISTTVFYYPYYVVE